MPHWKAAFTASLIATLVPVSAGAQVTSTLRSTFGAWSVVCYPPKGSTAGRCAMMQNVVADFNPDLGISVAFERTADANKNTIKVLAPLGSLVSKGIWTYVDGKLIGGLLFMKCLEEGCYAEGNMNAETIKKFAAGKSASFGIFETEEKGIALELDLDGFAAAYADLRP